MRCLALLGALVLGACASPPAPTDSPSAGTPSEGTPEGEPISTPFDAAGWVTAVRAASTDSVRVALSTALFDAVDWRVACGEDDPTAPRRGVVQLHDVDDRQTLAEITCDAGPYQSVFALVDAAAGKPPRLVRSLTVTEAGEPAADTTESFFGLVSTDDAPDGHFDILTKGAGHGGCGTDVRYRLELDSGARIARVRAHPDCDEPLAPDAWPVTYTEAP